jgi:hypothetical protein
MRGRLIRALDAALAMALLAAVFVLLGVLMMTPDPPKGPPPAPQHGRR